MEKIKVQIFQYHRLLVTENVSAISFSAQGKGAMTILPDHMPVIASIKDGPISFSFSTKAETTKKFWVQNAIFYFESNRANLVADEVKTHN